ncbi:Zn finger [Halorubrum virus HRTV-11]|nr:Zn finger [Halorubrum virus HRTV-11]
MRTCDFCGGPRSNGSPMKRDEDGRWRLASSYLPGHPDSVLACRSCAKEKRKTTAER